jgi:hypothetical protein
MTQIPPIWQLVLVTLSTDIALLCKWDGEQWWTADGLPIANHYVINWRSIN